VTQNIIHYAGNNGNNIKKQEYVNLREKRGKVTISKKAVFSRVNQDSTQDRCFIVIQKGYISHETENFRF